MIDAPTPVDVLLEAARVNERLAEKYPDERELFELEAARLRYEATRAVLPPALSTVERAEVSPSPRSDSAGLR